MSFHKTMTGQDIHTLVAYEFADAGTRTAYTGFTSEDVGKMVRQLDDESLYMILSTTPTYSGQIGAGASSSVVATQAYDIAVAGTNAADQAYQLAGIAFTLAQVGTNAADQASNTAVSALNSAWAGTSAANQAYALAATGYTLATSGTNAGNQAYDVAVSALETAWIGTNAGDQAYSIAVEALTAAWAGTSSTNFVQKSGDTMTGTLSVQNLVVQPGTLPSNFSDGNDWYMGTYTIDPTDVGLQTIYVTGSLTMTASPLIEGGGANVRLIHAADRDVTITFEPDWIIMPSTPSTLTAAKVSSLTVQIYGATQADVLGAYAAQS